MVINKDKHEYKKPDDMDSYRINKESFMLTRLDYLKMESLGMRQRLLHSKSCKNNISFHFRISFI